VINPRLRALLAISMLASGIDPIPRAPRRDPAPRDPTAGPVTVEDFHAHLDACERCRTRPFDLCSVGADLAERVGIGFSVGGPRGSLAAEPSGLDELQQALRRPSTETTVPPVAVPQDLDTRAFDEAERLLRDGFVNSEAERAHRELHVMRRAPGRSSLTDAAQANRKRKNKAARKARKRSRR
jgi:hypothetical protein